MQIGKRTLRETLRAVCQGQHYRALYNMSRIYPDFSENFIRYITGEGTYPYCVRVRTPIGQVKPLLYFYDDLLTVNEIFCREDYYVGRNIKVVVDVGANIGISALYFMTRNHACQCYLFEPDLRNVEKLRSNLREFEARYLLKETAVAGTSGVVRFGIESTGRYGGIEVEADDYIEVPCVDINEILQETLVKEESIDVLKLDIEGLEIDTVKSIRYDILKHIRKIYIEARPEKALHPTLFEQRQYGSVYQLTNKLAG